MKYNKPSKLNILKLDGNVKRHMPVVTTGQIFGEGTSFHPNGLFSVEIFGPSGSEERTEREALIELNIPVLQPIIYKHLVELGSIYSRVMEGVEYVIFDKETEDLVKSDDPKAQTGFNFMLKMLPKIKFRETSSERRLNKIKLIYKAIEENNYLTDSIIVIPAGIRDYMIGRDGRPEEDEINTFYRRIISSAGLIDPDRAKTDPASYDTLAYGLQKQLDLLYEYVMSLLEGKNKLLQGKWMARRVFNSSANVASTYVDTSTGIDDPRAFGYNDTRVGLHQYARSAVPLSTYNIKNKYIAEIFPAGADVVWLTNSKTLKKEEVVIRGIQSDVDLWTTSDGLEKVISSLGNFDLIDEPIIFKPSGSRSTYYMGLLYRDKNSFKFFQDIDELPEGLSRDNVTPVTLYEFIYMSIYHMSGKYPGFITRYPVTGIGSSYPSWIVCTTTLTTETLRELDQDWEPLDGDDYLAVHFPVKGSDYFRTMTVHVSHLGRLGGDFDGDTLHLKMLFTQEAIDEIKNYLNTKEYYVNDSGDLYYSTSNDVLNTVLKFMSNPV